MLALADMRGGRYRRGVRLVTRPPSAYPTCGDAFARKRTWIARPGKRSSSSRVRSPGRRELCRRTPTAQTAPRRAMAGPHPPSEPCGRRNSSAAEPLRRSPRYPPDRLFGAGRGRISITTPANATGSPGRDRARPVNEPSEVASRRIRALPTHPALRRTSRSWGSPQKRPSRETVSDPSVSLQMACGSLPPRVQGEPTEFWFSASDSRKSSPSLHLKKPSKPSTGSRRTAFSQGFRRTRATSITSTPFTAENESIFVDRKQFKSGGWLVSPLRSDPGAVIWAFAFHDTTHVYRMGFEDLLFLGRVEGRLQSRLSERQRNPFPSPGRHLIGSSTNQAGPVPTCTRVEMAEWINFRPPGHRSFSEVHLNLESDDREDCLQPVGLSADGSKVVVLGRAELGHGEKPRWARRRRGCFL